MGLFDPGNFRCPDSLEGYFTVNNNPEDQRSVYSGIFDALLVVGKREVCPEEYVCFMSTYPEHERAQERVMRVAKMALNVQRAIEDGFIGASNVCMPYGRITQHRLNSNN